MLKWQGKESRIKKVKLHSYIAYRIAMLVLKISMDMHFCMLLKGLDLVEETCSVLVLHWNHGITTTINDPESILVCLSTIRHKSLKLRLGDSVFYHYII